MTTTELSKRRRTATGRARFGRRAGRIAAACGLVALASLTVGAVGTSALVAHLADQAVLSYQPAPAHQATARIFSATGPRLEYHGGAVMPSNANYLIFWKAPKTKFATGYVAGIKAYMKNLAHDSGKETNVDSLLVQYGANYESSVAGSIIDKDPLPPNGCPSAPKCLTYEQLTAEIAKVVEGSGLPRDLTHEYFLFTAEGVESCFEPAGHACSANASYGVYCAYHSYISTPGGPIVFSNDPYVYGKACDEPGHHPNGPGDAALLGGLSHEHSESVTDPELNAWRNEYGEEVGDICRTFEPESEFGTPLGYAEDGSPYNQVINKHLYWYQQEWSNEAAGCRQHA